MKRYAYEPCDMLDCRGEFFEIEDGEYIRYEDAEKMLELIKRPVRDGVQWYQWKRDADLLLKELEQ